jgi:chloramphenicol 3-O-phosphotransferase
MPGIVPYSRFLDLANEVLTGAAHRQTNLVNGMSVLALGPVTPQTSLVMSPRGRVIVITGAMAAGKSTVADLLAIRLPKSVHIHGDVFRWMVVNGRADMTPNPSADAIAQLNLRYDLAAMTADRFAEEGYDVIVQDVILGKDLADFVKRIETPERYLVVLSPRVSALEWREEQRSKAGYVHFSPAGLDDVLRRETAQIGYWLDSSTQTPDETVQDILDNLQRAAV